MSLFRRKTPHAIPYDPETQEPAVQSSICTGEMVVGFIDRKTGKFRKYELARGQGDVETFWLSHKFYGITDSQRTQFGCSRIA